MQRSTFVKFWTLFPFYWANFIHCPLQHCWDTVICWKTLVWSCYILDNACTILLLYDTDCINLIHCPLQHCWETILDWHSHDQVFRDLSSLDLYKCLAIVAQFSQDSVSLFTTPLDLAPEAFPSHRLHQLYSLLAAALLRSRHSIQQPTGQVFTVLGSYWAVPMLAILVQFFAMFCLLVRHGF